jgi:hypothetical protein
VLNVMEHVMLCYAAITNYKFEVIGIACSVSKNVHAFHSLVSSFLLGPKKKTMLP